MDNSDSIRALAFHAVESIKGLSDAEKAEQVQKYFKETVKSYGVSARQVRQVAAEIYKAKKNRWKEDEILSLCELLLQEPHIEIKSMAGILAAQFADELSPKAFFKIKQWLENDLCDNWAAVDTLCPNTMGRILRKYPELLRKIKQWTVSPNRWVRRASLVSFIKLTKDKNFHDVIYEISLSLFNDKDDLVQKANGWLLRETGKTDPEKLKNFLLLHGPHIPRTTLRYAVERYDPETRKFILEETRK